MIYSLLPLSIRDDPPSVFEWQSHRASWAYQDVLVADHDDFGEHPPFDRDDASLILLKGLMLVKDREDQVFNPGLILLKKMMRGP